MSWAQFEVEAPDLASRVLRRFAMGTNKTLATLRRDGSPRISTTELEIRDGEVAFGMMGGSMKLHDVRRDPRVALHSPTIDATPEQLVDWPGDAKFSGLAVEQPPPADNKIDGAGFFHVDLREIVLTYVGDPAEFLVVEAWHPGRGTSKRRRY